MPNLSSWIEAQLKRGYTKAEVKAHLSRKGYSSKVVAEVDNFNVAKAKSRKMSNSKSTNSVIIILVIAVLIAIAIYVFGNNNGEQVQQDVGDDQAQTQPAQTQGNQGRTSANSRIEIFDGTLVEINGNIFTLSKEGSQFTVSHDSQNPIRYFSRSSDGSINPITEYNGKAGDQLILKTIFDEVTNTREIRRLLIDNISENISIVLG